MKSVFPEPNTLADAPTPTAKSAGFRRYAVPRIRRGYAEESQRFGQSMIVAGFGIAMAGMTGYCTLCLLSGFRGDVGDLLMQNSVPFGRWAIGVLGVGTFIWLVGAYHFFMGTLMADEQAANANVEDD